MKHLILLIAAAFQLTYGMEVDAPFEPALAADQPEIDFQSLTSEFSQFQKLNSYYGLHSQLESKKNERDFLKKNYERDLELYKKGHLSEFDFKKAEYQYQVAEGEVARLQGQTQKQRLSAEVDKLVIFDVGNPSVDRRREIAGKLKEIVQTDLQVLSLGEKTATIARDYMKERFDKSGPLCRSGTLSEVECEQRKLSYENAQLQLEVIEKQKATMQQSLDGMEKSLRRLFQNKRR